MMFAVLPESSARRPRRAKQMVVSVVVHAVLIAAAVRASGLNAAPPKPERVDITPIYVAPPEHHAPPPPDEPRRAPSTAPAMSTAAAPNIKVAVAPIDVPTGIPDVSVPLGNTISAPDFNGPPSSSTGTRAGSGSGAPSSPSDIYEARYVEKPVVPLPGNPAPRYPRMLEDAGVEGSVVVQFVVDTVGRADVTTMRVLSSTRAEFTRAVQDAIARMRFVPAEAGGRRVKQLVEQAFHFERREF